MDILYQDNRIAVCLKPPGVLSTDEPGGMPALLRAALTEKINDREVYMKGIDASYHYEGYHVFKTEDLT